MQMALLGHRNFPFYSETLSLWLSQKVGHIHQVMRTISISNF